MKNNYSQSFKNINNGLNKRGKKNKKKTGLTKWNRTKQLKILVVEDGQISLHCFAEEGAELQQEDSPGSVLPLDGISSLISTFLVSTVSSMGTLAAKRKTHKNTPRIIITAWKH